MTIAKKLALAFLTFAGLAAVPAAGRAECISIPSTLEQTFDASRVVFVADVLAVDAAIDPEPFRYRVRFRVIESFKGTERGEQVFYFRTTADDFSFKAGIRVLVYAGGPADRLSTACSPTRVVGEGDSEVQALRKLSRVKR